MPFQILNKYAYAIHKVVHGIKLCLSSFNLKLEMQTEHKRPKWGKKILQIRDAKGRCNNKWGHGALIDRLSSTKGSLFGDDFGLHDNVWLCVLYDIINFTFLLNPRVIE